MRRCAFSACGRALLLAGAEGLRCWGWEPAVCHDTLAVPWKQVADAHVHGGAARLLCASLHTSFVSLWVTDLSRTAPWADAAQAEACRREEAAAAGGPGSAAGRGPRQQAETTQRAAAQPPAPPVAASWARPDAPSAARAAAVEQAQPRAVSHGGQQSAGAAAAAAAAPPQTPPAAAAAQLGRLSIHGSPVLSPAQLREAMRGAACAEESGGEGEGEEEAHAAAPAAAAAVPAVAPPQPQPPARTSAAVFTTSAPGAAPVPALAARPSLPTLPAAAAARGPEAAPDRLSAVLGAHEGLAARLWLRLSLVSALCSALQRGDAHGVAQLLARGGGGGGGDDAAVVEALGDGLRFAAASGFGPPRSGLLTLPGAAALLPHLPPLLLGNHVPRAQLAMACAEAYLAPFAHLLREQQRLDNATETLSQRPVDLEAHARRERCAHAHSAFAGLMPALGALAERDIGALSGRARDLAAAIERLSY